MLTGCTEVPANEIGKLFGFDKVISTEFNSGKKLKKIISDTYGNLKIGHIQKKKDQRYIYYTDNTKTENKFIKFVDKVIEV